MGLFFGRGDFSSSVGWSSVSSKWGGVLDTFHPAVLILFFLAWTFNGMLISLGLLRVLECGNFLH